MVLSASKAPVLIPGYRCINRLGAGGFGEVWRVAAPGGLEKAIKVVYGLVDEDRATRELKSLDRIKRVRHPFLLSLERIEIIDGRLMIVTELAEGCLADRFKECKAKGLRGIPRSELVGYLRDAADALDFMLQQHSLQHLDVKPENLLLVGGHTKIADFGLVKELADIKVSMVGGLTPVYASPETFSDAPSRQSDQYSLAVVYQELLTGKLPFVGTTLTQLAMQHAQGCPHLLPLPPLDRPIVGRALSKDPQARFSSSSEFVRALFDASEGPSPIVIRDEASHSSDTREARAEDTSCRESAPKQQAAASNTEILRTEVLDNPEGRGDSAALHRANDASRPAIHVSTAVERIEPVRGDGVSHTLRPAMFIGVGGLGGEIVRRVKGRMDLLTDDAAPDATRYLAIDTDPDALNRIGRHKSGVQLSFNDRLCMPLRSPGEYKTMSVQLLDWISRRWLYNIPRSLRTQGFRPLGRLALFDRQAAMIDAVKSRLEQLKLSSDAPQSPDVTAVAGEEIIPRVFVIGSVSGGTGGGMLLDVGAAARRLLGQLGLDSSDVTGVLLHVTNRHPTQSALAIANSYATLCELYHLTKNGAKHAGEPSDDDNAATLSPFDRRHFVDLGEDLGDGEFDEPLERIVDYLVSHAGSSLGAAIDASREPDSRLNDLDVELRSLAVHRVTSPQTELVDRIAGAVVAEVARRWISDCRHLPSAAGDTAADQGRTHTTPKSGRQPEPSSSDEHSFDVQWIEEHVAHEFGNLCESEFAVATWRMLLKQADEIDHSVPSQQGEFEQHGMITLSTAAKQLRKIRTLATPETPIAVDSPVVGQEWTTTIPQMIPRLADRVAKSVWCEFVQTNSPKNDGKANGNDRKERLSLVDRLLFFAGQESAEMVRGLATEGSVDSHGRLVPDKQSLIAALDETSIALDGCGYSYSDYVILPHYCASSPIVQSLTDALSDRATVLTSRFHDDALVIREAGRISLAHVAHRLISRRQDLFDAAHRLHTRKDIDWVYPPRVETDDDAPVVEQKEIGEPCQQVAHT